MRFKGRIKPQNKMNFLGSLTKKHSTWRNGAWFTVLLYYSNYCKALWDAYAKQIYDINMP